MKGIFISMEGPDGSGKSTQIGLLEKHLRDVGYDDIVITREPGGTRISEAVRELILNKEYTEMGYMTEAMLYAAARAQLVSEVIAPALEAGKAVISDRFVDSSVVYQGMARGLGVENVYNINLYATQGIMPDITIHLDLPAEIGLGRAKGRAELDRIELESVEFHNKVAQGYRDLAGISPDRIKTIDATLAIEKIHEIITDYVDEIIKN